MSTYFWLMNHDTLHTSRLEIVIVTPALIHEIFDQLNTQEQMQFFGVDEQGLSHYREMHEAGMETHRISMKLFLLKLNGVVIGECGFHTWNIRHHRAELFYVIRNDENKRKGYVSEALPVILAHGFNDMNLNRIAALTADWNHASLAVMKKFGFTFEGVMREDYVVGDIHEDSVCYSLLKREWLNTQL